MAIVRFCPRKIKCITRPTQVSVKMSLCTVDSSTLQYYSKYRWLLHSSMKLRCLGSMLNQSSLLINALFDVTCFWVSWLTNCDQEWENAQALLTSAMSTQWIVITLKFSATLDYLHHLKTLLKLDRLSFIPGISYFRPHFWCFLRTSKEDKKSKQSLSTYVWCVATSE